MALQVIGAGFGRTGTLSLKAALERLGFAKCHHMFEVGQDPAQQSYWLAISRGERVDWDDVFEGYQSSCDFPSCVYWEELHRHFPDSKVILSTRDPEKWYQSAADTIYAISTSLPTWIPSKQARGLREMVLGIVWNGVFDGRFEDKEYALSVFRDHEKHVKDSVAPERLLIFEAKDGWEPLCRFLGVPVPDEPFPNLNDTASIQHIARRMKMLSRLPWLLFAALVATGLLWWVL